MNHRKMKKRGSWVKGREECGGVGRSVPSSLLNAVQSRTQSKTLESAESITFKIVYLYIREELNPPGTCWME